MQINDTVWTYATISEMLDVFSALFRVKLYRSTIPSVSGRYTDVLMERMVELCHQLATDVGSSVSEISLGSPTLETNSTRAAATSVLWLSGGGEPLDSDMHSHKW